MKILKIIIQFCFWIFISTWLSKYVNIYLFAQVENGISQIMRSLVTLGSHGVFNHLDILDWFIFLHGCLLPSIPIVPSPATQRSITTSLESGNHFLHNLKIFPLNPLPWPNQASWKLFPLCYFPEKQFSGDYNDNNNVRNIYWAVLCTKLCWIFCYVISFTPQNNLTKYVWVFTTFIK